MGRTVKDVAMLLDVQAGYDARAPLSLNDGARFNGALDGLDAKTVRIGWLGDLYGYLAMEPGVLDTCVGRYASSKAPAVPSRQRRWATPGGALGRLAGVAALAGRLTPRSRT